MIHIKKGASLLGLAPQMHIGLVTVLGAAVSLEARHTYIVITSGTERTTTHSYGSKHFSGNAVDVRSKMYSTYVKHEMLRLVREALGEEFDFILEYEGRNNEHFHLEYHPKG